MLLRFLVEARGIEPRSKTVGPRVSTSVSSELDLERADVPEAGFRVSQFGCFSLSRYEQKRIGRVDFFEATTKSCRLGSG